MIDEMDFMDGSLLSNSSIVLTKQNTPKPMKPGLGVPQTLCAYGLTKMSFQVIPSTPPV
jgi:hypothetical protein